MATGASFLWVLFLVYAAAAFGPSYLDGLSSKADQQNQQHFHYFGMHDESDKNEMEPPDEWYAKAKPMAGWAGYKHERWGGYLDNLRTESIPKETKSDNFPEQH